MEKTDEVKKESSEVSKRLYALIQKEGLSEVARRMGVHPSKFQYMGNGGGFTLDMMLGLSKVLGIDWNSVFYDGKEGDLLTVPDSVDSTQDAETLKDKLKELEALKEQNLIMQGELKAYQNMMANVIPFSRPLDDEKIKSEIKASGFNPAHEEARIIALNYDELSDNYYPEISEIGFTPNWMKRREQNASRA